MRSTPRPKWISLRGYPSSVLMRDTLMPARIHALFPQHDRGPQPGSLADRLGRDELLVLVEKQREALNKAMAVNSTLPPMSYLLGWAMFWSVVEVVGLVLFGSRLGL